MVRVLKVLVVVLVSMAFAQSAYGWGSAGHAVIGYIADCNLTPRARKMCSKYLGHSLAYHASWMDEWRYSEEYHHTARWHSVGVKEGEFVPSSLSGSTAYYAAPLTMDDHGVARLNQLQEELKNYRQLSDSAVVVNLKCIIHIVGDLHCPGHIFFADKKQYIMKEGGRKRNIHDYMDNTFIRFNKGKNAADFYDAYCRLTKAEIAKLCEGDMESWIRGNEQTLREWYTLLSPTIDYKELPEQNKLRLKDITDELHRNAGFRLAYIINQIFK